MQIPEIAAGLIFDALTKVLFSLLDSVDEAHLYGSALCLYEILSPHCLCIFSLFGIHKNNLSFARKSQLEDLKYRTTIYRRGSLHRSLQWLKWSCEAGGSPDDVRLEQTPYPFHTQLI